ncbi:MAG: alkaline phosphatase [Oscillospiraceae bacterium]
MKRCISFMVALIMLLSITPIFATTEDSLNYTKPYLLTLNPSQEMNVCWLTKDSSHGVIEYGETETLGNTQNAIQYELLGLKTSNKADGYDSDPEKNPDLKAFQEIATLKNLKPNTTYYYKTITTLNGKTETSKIYNFKTAPVNGEDFTFSLLSDLQLKEESPATVKQLGQNKPDFIIYGGDLINTPWKAGEWFAIEDCFIADNEKGKSWFEIMQQEEDGAELLQYTPLFITPGNHEVDDQRVYFDKEMAKNNDDWSLSIYMQMFRPLYPKQEYSPNGEHWYSVDYGDLHISNISAFRWQNWDGFEAPGWVMFDDISADSAQIKWLENDLKSSASKYKWVNMHWHMLNRGDDGYFPYSKPVTNGNEVTYPEGDLAHSVLKPLYEKYDVNAVSFGHSHVYERYLINDVNYIEAASIGNNYRADNDPFHPSGNKPVMEKNNIRSFMLLKKDSTGIHATGIAASGTSKGTAFDTFNVAEDNKKPASSSKIKNVILLIPDGQSVGGTTLTRWYNGGEALAIDEMATGLMRTYSADAAIADSAPAATAFATGHKSHTGFIGVLPDENTMPNMPAIKSGDERRPVANILEAAQIAQKSTGLIATSEIMHATPAAFSAHDPSRKNYDSLSEQQVYQDIDVVLGAGSKYFTKEVRGDGEDLISEIKTLGYDYITTPQELENTQSDKIWGMFADSDLPYEFDADKSKYPSLATMTSKAINTLKRNDNGFFLMVEGSKIDWASHANDPIGIISDTLAFNDAIQVALDFAKSNTETVVISVTDHGNGGITIGNKATDSTYDKTPLENYINPLKAAKLTGEGVEKKLNADRSNIVEVMSEYYGISDLSDEEITEIYNTEAGKMNYTVGPMISKRADIGWTTTGHTGEDVPLYIYAPEGYKISGVIENSDIAKYMESLMNLTLSTATDNLFIPARSEFESLGATVTWNDSDSKNPIMVAEKEGKVIEFPINKNLAIVNGKTVKLDGVVVYNGINTYVPQSAINLMK